MTPTDKNNEPFDAVLRRAMRNKPGPATPECADAESLAAYSDKSIAAAERERLETHFADCMRCQVLLADIARAEEGARVAEPASGADVPWYRRWRIVIPALAAAAAVVVFVAMRRLASVEGPNDQLAVMAKNEAVPATSLAAPKPAVAPAAPAALLAPAPAAAPASKEIAMNDAARAEAPRAQAMGAFGGAMARSAAAPAAGAMVAGAGAPGQSESFAEGPLVTIEAPGGSVAWIVGRSGMVRRRDANGGIQMQQSGVKTDLTAGAAPSASVCWIVGGSGTVIRTTDGVHWTVVAAPTTENLAAVSASSANDATITTASGKSLATSDGGASWHQQ